MDRVYEAVLWASYHDHDPMVGAYHHEDQWRQNRPRSTTEDGGRKAYMQFSRENNLDRKSSGNGLLVLFSEHRLIVHRFIPIGCTYGG